MAHENARSGIGKVFAAEVLQIIGVAVMLLAFIPKTGFALGTSISGIILIIALIVSLVGLSKAGKDNAKLKTAFVLSVVIVIISILVGFLQVFAKATWVSQFGQILSMIFALIVTYNVLMGCAQLNPNLADKAKSTWTLYLIVIMLDIILTMLGITLGVMGVTDTSFVVTVVMVILDMVLDLIAYIKYLIFLNTARKEV